MNRFFSTLFLVTPLCVVFSQQEVTRDSIPEVLDEVIINGNGKMLGSKFEARNRTGSAVYISTEELHHFNYTDVNRVLRNVPGVSIYEEDGFGLRPNISLRGSAPERSSKITLMEDGVLIAPAPYSAPAAYYFPTIGRMDAVEILKGSSQVQYGPYTTGGAINMVSRQIPREFAGNLRLSYGNYNTRNTDISLGDSHDNFGYTAQYYNYNSDGFKHLLGDQNTGFDKTDYVGKFRVNTNPGAKVFQSLTFKVQYSEETSNETYLGLTQADFDRDPYARYIASEKDRMDTEHQQLQLTHLIKPAQNIKVTTTAYFNSFHRNWYKLNNVNLPETTGLGGILAHPQDYPDAYQTLTGVAGDTADDVFGVKANNRDYESKGIQTKANFSFGENSYHDIEVGLRYHEDFEDRFQWVDGYALRSGRMVQTSVGEHGSDANRITSAQALAAHALYKVRWGELTLTPGLRYENIRLTREDYGKEDPHRLGHDLSSRENQVDVFIPGVGAHYKLNRDWAFYGGVHKGFAPPGTEEGAKNEQSLNIEVGTRFHVKGLQGELAGYYNHYTNMLGSDLAASGGTGSLDVFNAGEALVMGLEAVLNYDLLQNKEGNWHLPLSFTYTLTHATFQSDFDSAVGIYGEVSDGDLMPYIVPQQFNLTAGLENERFGLTLSGRYNSAFRTQAGTGSIPDHLKVGNNFIVDANARYRLSKQVSLFANLYNLTNSEYLVARLPAGLRPGAPFMIGGGMQCTF